MGRNNSTVIDEKHFKKMHPVRFEPTLPSCLPIQIFFINKSIAISARLKCHIFYLYEIIHKFQNSDF